MTKERDKLRLANWNLPPEIVSHYEKLGVKKLFPWQVQCLQAGNALKGGNLLYSAPTSAGKTLVAELLMVKRILKTKRKAIFILPFISVAREKMFALRRMVSGLGLTVGGFMGAQTPPGGFQKVDIAVCTIERANSMINHLLESGNLSLVSLIIVDELHMIGDESRGCLLEPLLTKITFHLETLSEDSETDSSIQIIGMSATLPNMHVLANWLKADLYCTDFRPVPLTEYVKIGTSILDSQLEYIRDIQIPGIFNNDDEQIVNLCLETVSRGKSVLIFCPTKAWCEKLSTIIAKAFFSLLRDRNPDFLELAQQIDEAINKQKILEVLDQLKKSPAGLSSQLFSSISYVTAYHHAGLTMEEKDIIEAAFKDSVIRVLIATTTLSSGVNLPAHRVIIRSPMFLGKLIDTLTYKQMVGRAGRKGIDESGESILICKESEKKNVRELLTSDLQPATSQLIRRCDDGSYLLRSSVKRALLEVIASGTAKTMEMLYTYIKCTLLAAEIESNDGDMSELVKNCVKTLADDEFIQVIPSDQGELLVPTQLGSAVFASSMRPDESLVVLSDLNNARKSFVLENELHMVYQVTPLSGGGESLDWMRYAELWDKLPTDQRRVGELVGVSEKFIFLSLQGKRRRNTDNHQKSLQVHRRFYTALMLHDLINEMTLAEVEKKYGINKGSLQSLQQQAATFAGMICTFCSKLGWTPLKLLLADFQQRLDLGVKRELVDLIRIECLDGKKARHFYNSGIHTVSELVAAGLDKISQTLQTYLPFESSKQGMGESEWETRERTARIVYITGRKSLTITEAAQLILDEAKDVFEEDLRNLGFNISIEQLKNTSVLIQESNSKELEDSITSFQKSLEGVEGVKPIGTGRNTSKLKTPAKQVEPSVNHSLSPSATLRSSRTRKRSSLLRITPRCKSSSAAVVVTDSQDCNKQSKYSQLLNQWETCGNESTNNQTIKSPEQPDPTTNMVPSVHLNETEKLLSKESADDNSCKEVDELFSSLEDGKPSRKPSSKSDILGDILASTSCKADQPIKRFQSNSPSNATNQSDITANVKRRPASPIDNSFTKLKRMRTRISRELTPKSLVNRLSLSANNSTPAAVVKSTSSAITSTPAASSSAACTPSGQAGTSSLSELWSSFNDSSIISPDKSDGKSRKLTEAFPEAVDVHLYNTAATEGVLKTPKSSRSAEMNSSTESVDLFSKSMDSLVWSPLSELAGCTPPPNTKVPKRSPEASSLFGVLSKHMSNHLNQSPTSTKLQKISIIDVTADSSLFDTFIEDWKSASRYSLSLACADLPVEQAVSSQLSIGFSDSPQAIINNSSKYKDKPSILSTSILPSVEGVVLHQYQTVAVGMAVCFSADTAFYIDFTRDDDDGKQEETVSLDKILSITASMLAGNAYKIVYDSKAHMKRLTSLLKINNFINILDPKVAMWLTDPSDKESNLFGLMTSYAPQLIDSCHDMGACVGTGSIGLHPHPSSTPRLRSCLESITVWAMFHPLLSTLNAQQLLQSYEQIEMPHLICLAKMESRGFGFNVDEFKSQTDSIMKLIQSIEEQSYKYSRRCFDLSSVKDIGEVLFIDLKLPYEKKKVTSKKQLPWSTAQTQLDKIKHLHPLPGMIMLWRKLHSTLKTLIEPLNESKTWSEECQMYRIYPRCSIHTSTGRITMFDPNLQTMRKDFSVELDELPMSIGQSISLRNIFYAPEGYVLLSADYSQLELRIISHLASDPTLVQLLNSGGDVFRDIASRWKAVALEQVTDEQRQHAKQMCYGIIYGMGSKTLSEQLNVEETTAEQLMTQFQLTFTGLKKYVNQVIDGCREAGYVTTIAGRRRYLPSINSHKTGSRSQAERQAVNTTVQGSAADVIKLATINIDKQISKNSQLVLQIHDELIYEVPFNELEDSARTIKTCMEEVTSALNLSVKLTVRIKKGQTWAQLTDYNL